MVTDDSDLWNVTALVQSYKTSATQLLFTCLDSCGQVASAVDSASGYLDMTSSLHDCVMIELLKHVRKAYQTNHTLPDDLLSALHFVFKTPLLQAFDLVDNQSVTRLTCPAGRVAYKVLGSSGIPYVCFPSSNFCSCQYYSFTVLKKKDVDLCKHVLAVLLSCTMGVCQEQEVSNDLMTQTLTPGQLELAGDYVQQT